MEIFKTFHFGHFIDLPYFSDKFARWLYRLINLQSIFPNELIRDECCVFLNTSLISETPCPLKK